MGCFAKGCLTVLILGFLCIAGVIGTTWYVFHRLASTHVISDSPIAVQLDQPSEAQYQAAENSLTQLKTAASERREQTVAFTAADLNALLARDPDFRDLEGHARVEIANSTMTIMLSAPLDGVFWGSKNRRRWFNGIVTFTGRYENGEFQINLESASGGDYEVPGYVLSHVNSNINQVLSENIDDWRREAGVDLRRVKTATIQGDKLIVTTKAE